MPRFRKKPVEIEARQLPTFDSIVDFGDYIEYGFKLAEWCGGSFDVVDCDITIETLEGNMKASPGDWIIKGVKGEFYPCKPDIFEATYDKEEDDVVESTK